VTYWLKSLIAGVVKTSRKEYFAPCTTRSNYLLHSG
jgi:hypothetical protein